MPLAPYDPFGPIRRDLDLFGNARLLDDDWFQSPMANIARVRIDVRESQDEVVVAAEIPGLENKEDVSIRINDNLLHIRGKVERTNESKGENVHHTERYFGQFARTVTLPASVNDVGAEASYRNGILEVRLPKAQQQKGKEIDVDFFH